jgi:hypothetical protein
LAEQISNLAEAWKPAMSWSMKDLIGRAWPKEPLPEADETSVREFREALARLKDVVRTIGKQGFVTDLSALVGALTPHDREDLASFVKACRSAPEMVQAARRIRIQICLRRCTSGFRATKGSQWPTWRPSPLSSHMRRHQARRERSHCAAFELFMRATRHPLRNRSLPLASPRLEPIPADDRPRTTRGAVVLRWERRSYSSASNDGTNGPFDK